jgi:hypothetical protein
VKLALSRHRGQRADADAGTLAVDHSHEERLEHALALLHEQRDALTARVKLLHSKVVFADRALENCAVVVAAAVEERNAAYAARDAALMERDAATAQVIAAEQSLQQLREQVVADGRQQQELQERCAACECKAKDERVKKLEEALRERESMLMDCQVRTPRLMGVGGCYRCWFS